nr:TraR/DksA C4-type zinc finger protein [uncultured Desulfobacter sp.]
MDECDIAAGHEQFFRNMAIEKARCGDDQPICTECIDCGEPIPLARRKAMPGCCRCIPCQEAFERSS